MATLSLVLVALPMAVLIGFAFGYLAYRSQRARWITLPLLDLMQTVPAFAYLIPIPLLFGFGLVVGLVASVIFAIPPMVRNRLLGFQSIPPAILASARMSGCTGWQRFIWAEIPTAWRQMLIGVNQTTAATLSLVVIAAIIGGFDDIGWAVLSSMRKAQFGQSLMSGLVIVVMAIMLDRITAAYAARTLKTALRPRHFFTALVGALTYAVASAVPDLWLWPEWATYSPAQDINRAVESLLVRDGRAEECHALLSAAADQDRVRECGCPVYLGHQLCPRRQNRLLDDCGTRLFGGFCKRSLAVGNSRGVGHGIRILRHDRPAVAMGAGFRRAAGMAAWWLAFGAVCGQHCPVFAAKRPLETCYAIGLSLFGLGSGLHRFGWTVGGLGHILVAGVARHSSDHDMLQTLPQFVLLIPALMLFQVGDFTALLAMTVDRILQALIRRRLPQSQA